MIINLSNHLKFVQTSNIPVLSNSSSTLARHGRTTFGDPDVTANFFISVQYLENDKILHMQEKHIVFTLPSTITFNISGGTIFCLIPLLYEMIEVSYSNIHCTVPHCVLAAVLLDVSSCSASGAEFGAPSSFLSAARKS